MPRANRFRIVSRRLPEGVETVYRWLAKLVRLGAIGGFTVQEVLGLPPVGERREDPR